MWRSIAAVPTRCLIIYFSKLRCLFKAYTPSELHLDCESAQQCPVSESDASCVKHRPFGLRTPTTLKFKLTE